MAGRGAPPSIEDRIGSLRAGRRRTRTGRASRTNDDIAGSTRCHEEGTVAIDRPVSLELIVGTERKFRDPNPGRIRSPVGDGFRQINHIDPPPPTFDDVLNACQSTGLGIPVKILIEEVGPHEHAMGLDARGAPKRGRLLNKSSGS